MSQKKKNGHNFSGQLSSLKWPQIFTECVETDQDFIFHVLLLFCFQVEPCRSIPKRRFESWNVLARSRPVAIELDFVLFKVSALKMPSSVFGAALDQMKTRWSPFACLTYGDIVGVPVFGPGSTSSPSSAVRLLGGSAEGPGCVSLPLLVKQWMCRTSRIKLRPHLQAFRLQTGSIAFYGVLSSALWLCLENISKYWTKTENLSLRLKFAAWGFGHK